MVTWEGSGFLKFFIWPCTTLTELSQVCTKSILRMTFTFYNKRIGLIYIVDKFVTLSHGTDA